jgi:hypothetical protein
MDPKSREELRALMAASLREHVCDAILLSGGLDTDILVEDTYALGRKNPMAVKYGITVSARIYPLSNHIF